MKLTKKLNNTKIQGLNGVKTDLAYEELEVSPVEESPEYATFSPSNESPEYAPYSPGPTELSPSDAALFGEGTPEPPDASETKKEELAGGHAHQDVSAGDDFASG
jgi:hypothetical protein